VQSRGRLVAVCSSPGGIPKTPLLLAHVDERGIAGDGHRFHLHGGPDRALCLLSEEEARWLAEDGVRPTSPGTFGENLRTDGLDYRALKPGDRLRVLAGEAPGEEDVLIELFDVRAPCRTLQSIDARFPDLMAGRSGFVARVLRGGELRPGMELRVEDPAADVQPNS
jgi:MOSC domain-containing protein YiiM